MKAAASCEEMLRNRSLRWGSTVGWTTKEARGGIRDVTMERKRVNEPANICERRERPRETSAYGLSQTGRISQDAGHA